MRAIGLRSRFFIIILIVLVIISFLSVFLHAFLLKKERLEYIDQQVRETALILVESKLGDLRLLDLESAEKIVSEELGENKIGKFFIIRNTQGDVIFSSIDARTLSLIGISQQPQWITLSVLLNPIRHLGNFINDLSLKISYVYPLPDVNLSALKMLRF